jgi:hypothetical protein
MAWKGTYNVDPFAGMPQYKTPGHTPAWMQSANNQYYQNYLSGAYSQRGQGGGGGGGGGSGGMGGSWMDAFNSANAANESRYQDILGQYTTRYNKAMDFLKGSGEATKNSASEHFKQTRAAADSDLISRGMRTSTQAAHPGQDRREALTLADIDEQVRRESLQTHLGASADGLGFMERREDVGPDLGMMAQLFQQMGQGGQGGGMDPGFDYVSPQQLYGFGGGGGSGMAYSPGGAWRGTAYSGRAPAATSRAGNRNFNPFASGGGKFDMATYDRLRADRTRRAGGSPTRYIPGFGMGRADLAGYL